MYEVSEINQNMSVIELWHNIRRQGWCVVQVDKDDYDKAITAHGKGYFVEVIGKMIKRAKSKAVMECEAFRIID